MNPLDFISKKILFVALAASLLVACARQGAPTGGPKDTDPPVVDTVASTRNFSTRFTERRIELVFDEWVTLTDVGAQVVISPPLKNRPRPDISLKGKKVIVEFSEKDTLRPNTTYTINFGSAVKDLHEGNPAKDLRFVFSTGDFLDSLRVNGKVVDAFTGQPVENVSVMLYDNLSDSVVRKEKPYYFARTDKTGLFSIQNVRTGTYKVAAIEDATGGDLKWDGQNERIGFPDSLLLLNDTMKPILNLKVFKSQSKLRLADPKTLRYGLVKLGYNATPDSVKLRTDAPGIRYVVEKVQDTLLVWYDMAEPAAWELYADGDTVKVRDLPRADFLEKHKLALADETSSQARGKFAPATPPGTPPPIKNISQNPVKPGVLKFNTPISAVDTSKWQFVLDSVPNTDFSVKTDSAALRNLNIEIAWKFGKAYKLTLLPGAVTDFYGVANADTLQRIFNVFSEKQLGALSLTLENLLPNSGYVLQLLNGSTLEEERVFVADSTNKKLSFSHLPAATYTAQLIEDQNKNGRWDTGDYFARRQPEPVFSKKLEALRANWEIEATMRAAAAEPKEEEKK